MKANEVRFLEFIRKAPQLKVPIYQRTYTWSKEECRQLWNDIMQAGSSDHITSHFIGSIVYVEEGFSTISLNSTQLVIDGQQRLTTLILLITALYNHLIKLPENQQEPWEGFYPAILKQRYLINSEEKGDKRFKLILSQTDKDSLISIVKGAELPKEFSIRIKENYEDFKNWIANEKNNLAILCKGMIKLLIVDIKLLRDQDNPQLIFESMNSTGKELTQTDLIRNFILMGLEEDLQTQLYENYWRPMEMDFGQKAYSDYFDGFIRHYLTLKNQGKIPVLSRVYESFKEYAHSPEIESAGIEALLKDIRKYSKYFCAMAFGSNTIDPELNRAFHDLRDLKIDVTYPLLLELYDDYSGKKLSKSNFIKIIQLVESYIFRRTVCAIPTNSLNLTFATLAGKLDKNNYLESIQARMLLMRSYRRFPTDEEFMQEIQTRDMYNATRRSYWLRKMENYNHKEPINVESYTIEHILPQNPSLSQEWKEMLGPEWKRIQETWLHTLGNLTLTGYNSEYSDRIFTQKRDMPGGFRESHIMLNKELGKLEKWDENTIKARAKILSQIACDIWKAPEVNDKILEKYKDSSKRQPTKYSIQDHPYLLKGSTSELFKALRKEIINLDSEVIIEEFLKVYVVYKAEKAFVEMVPQSKRLILSLNINIVELEDPKGICRNVENINRWTNGPTEVFLNSFEELPYIMGLISQAYEIQTANGE